MVCVVWLRLSVLSAHVHELKQCFLDHEEVNQVDPVELSHSFALTDVSVQVEVQGKESILQDVRVALSFVRDAFFNVLSVLKHGRKAILLLTRNTLRHWFALF